jgi:hypothetical protein
MIREYRFLKSGSYCLTEVREEVHQPNSHVTQIILDWEQNLKKNDKKQIDILPGNIQFMLYLLIF